MDQATVSAEPVVKKGKGTTRPKPLHERRREVKDTRDVLVERFPDTFMPRGQRKKPLKLGIAREVYAAVRDISRNKLHKALADYTSGPTYLREVVEGAERVGLDGLPAGAVSQDGEWHAKARLVRVERHVIRAPMEALLEAIRKIVSEGGECHPDAMTMRTIAEGALASHVEWEVTDAAR